MHMSQSRRYFRACLALLLLHAVSVPLVWAEREIRISSAPDRLFDIPFYLSVPIRSWLDDPRLVPGATLPSGEPIIRLATEDLGDSPIALRLIVMRDDPNSRSSAAGKLFKAGLLQDGDVVLTFHANWANTMPYPHIQMGISHTGTIFTEGDGACNIDMPLDEIYDGTNLTGHLNSPHYLETETLHVVRPRSFSSKSKANLRAWVQRLRGNYSAIRSEGLLPFNSDYLTPRYKAFGITPLQSVERFGNVIDGRDRSSAPARPSACTG